ncbi:MAG TPA: aspartyl protease family protein, partial [Pyrinomonadaceae bacterium]|nr:aspartyl protease family protein [Pyrinomonadaceae bacterium]
MKISTIALMSFLLACCVCAYSQTAKAPVEVPFEFLHNQIVVQVKVNGKGPYNMLFDTDTDPSAIDLAVARELGLQ